MIFISGSLIELQETFKNTKEKDEVLSNLLGKITYLDLLKFEDRQNMQTSDQKGSWSLWFKKCYDLIMDQHFVQKEN